MSTSIPQEYEQRQRAVDGGMSRPPELLAPAGGPDAFLAAIANGADAVYVGLGSLNARRGAENFEPDSLAAMCRSQGVGNG